MRPSHLAAGFFLLPRLPSTGRTGAAAAAALLLRLLLGRLFLLFLTLRQLLLLLQEKNPVFEPRDPVADMLLPLQLELLRPQLGGGKRPLRLIGGRSCHRIAKLTTLGG